MSFQRLKVRRDAIGEFVKYDSGEFSLDWINPRTAPSVGAHVFVSRAPEYWTNGKRLYLYRGDYMSEYIGTAHRRRIPSYSHGPARDKSDGRFQHQYGVIAQDSTGREAAQCQDCGQVVCYGGDRLAATYATFDEFQIAESMEVLS